MKKKLNFKKFTDRELARIYTIICERFGLVSSYEAGVMISITVSYSYRPTLWQV